MATPAEFLYDSCSCDSGMRNGARCADCGGRGIVPKGTKPTGATVAETDLVDDDDDGLEGLSMRHLQSRAKDLGLSAGGSRAALTQRIREAVGETDESGDEDGDEQDDGEDEDDEPVS